MGWTMDGMARLGWMGIVGALVSGCTPPSKGVGQIGGSDDDGTGTPESSDGGADSMTGPSATAGGPDDGGGTGGAEAPDDEGPWDETTGAEPDDDSTGPGDVECVEEDWPACSWEGTDCVFSLGYNCGQCNTYDVPEPLCFGISQECAYPWLECPELPESPCGVVRALGAGTITGFEDEDAAICLLESVRDGIAGVYTIEYGQVGDENWPYIEVLVGSNGTATMQIDLQCIECLQVGTFMRSFSLGLQPQSYFDECLLAPTTESLALCILGFTEYEVGDPSHGWTPAFTTGECVEDVFQCPPA